MRKTRVFVSFVMFVSLRSGSCGVAVAEWQGDELADAEIEFRILPPLPGQLNCKRLK